MMRFVPLLLLAVFLGGCQVIQQSASPPAPATSLPQSSVCVYFSPNGGCTDAVVKAIGDARGTVLVQAYSFTSARIAKALLDAKKRGVDVRVLLDKSQAGNLSYSSVTFFRNSGIPAKVDRAHAIAHNKVMIIDGSVVITGSFNFTRAAEERNAENLLVIRDKKLAARYTNNWKMHNAHSKSSGRDRI